jgi:hypothetical protein
VIGNWNEKFAQMEFLLKEEEYKRIDAEEKLSILEHEMIQQGIEMDEKMAEMERTFMYRLLEEVTQSLPCATYTRSIWTWLLITERTELQPHRCKTRYPLVFLDNTHPLRSPNRTKRSSNPHSTRRKSLPSSGIGEFKSCVSR